MRGKNGHQLSFTASLFVASLILLFSGSLTSADIISVTSNPLWPDTGFTLNSTQTVTITPTGGSWNWGQAISSFGPAGDPFDSRRSDCWITSMPLGALVGYIGPGNPNSATRVVAQDGPALLSIGANTTTFSGKTGELWLGFNDDYATNLISDNFGSVTANVAVTPPPPLKLTGAVAFSADSSGNATGGEIWNTQGGDSWFNLYATEGGKAGTFINSGNGTSASLNQTLSPGLHTYTVFGENAVEGDFSHYGVNLFFNNNSSAPAISVVAPRNTTPNGLHPVFVANSGSTPALNGSSRVAGTGSLVYTNGQSTVKLVDFVWSNPSVYQTDRVSAFDSSPNGVNDAIGQFTISVTEL